MKPNYFIYCFNIKIIFGYKDVILVWQSQNNNALVIFFADLFTKGVNEKKRVFFYTIFYNTKNLIFP
jgi:hypothetical protein